MNEDDLKRAPLAYANENFVNSPDGRILRILSEYMEPIARFRREQIQDTVVFFGSARFHSRAIAEDKLAELKSTASQLSEGERETLLKRAIAGVEMARYYEDARRLAFLLSKWSIQDSSTPETFRSYDWRRPWNHGSGQSWGARSGRQDDWAEYRVAVRTNA